MVKKEVETVGKQVIFTQSRLMDFLTCERFEWYKYRAAGVGVEVVAKEDFFLEGEFGHYALHHWYKNPPHGLMLRENMVKRIKGMMDDLGEINPEDYERKEMKLAAMVGACHAYKVKYKDDFKKYEILFTEEQFEIDIEGITFRGKLDLGVKERETEDEGFVEHKFVSSFSSKNYEVLPLNLQQLIYTLGFKQITGKYPKWYIWNMIKKSQLRRTGTKPKKGEAVAHPEPLIQYESRVQQQYIEEPDKMFLRTPPRLVEANALEELRKMVAYHLASWVTLSRGKEIPAMRFSSCEGRYGSVCPFGPACVAQMAGHKDGWNSGECSGLYRKKVVQHPELEGGDKE